MALLGILIDKQTLSRVGDAVTGVSLLTYNHSLPATNPELLLPIARSIQGVQATGGSTNGVPVLCGLGGNASISTVAYVVPSVASAPTIMFDLYAIVFHSQIR